jgi:hypothetical protein
MTLESKAKTIKDFWLSFGDCLPASIADEKWVPLEEAQKLEAELAQTRKERDQCQSEKWKYGEQIGDANKIIDGINLTEYHDGDALIPIEDIKRLRSVLNAK